MHLWNWNCAKIGEWAPLALLPFLLYGCVPQQPSSPYPEVLQEWLASPDEAGLIDFSYAGYAGGQHKPSHSSKELPIFNVTEFGALPDDGRDDIAGIQAAINAAAAAGGGIVKVPKGQFDFDVNSSRGFLRIRHSNIILLGAGEGVDGTLIFDHASSPTPEPGKPWLAGMFPSFVKVAPAWQDEGKSLLEMPEQLRTAVLPAPRGSFNIRVENPENLQAGKVYLLTQQEASDSSLVKTLAAPLTKIGPRHLETSGPDSYKMQLLVRIDSISGNEVLLDAPLLMGLEARWQPKLWEIPEMLRNVAVLGFRLSNGWNEAFYHHLSGEHDNGRDGVSFSYVENGWVRSVIAYNSSLLAGLSNCLNCSVFDCQIRGLPGHNGFAIGGASTRNLVYNCRAGNSMHSFAVSGPASGNVYYNCSSGEPSAIDLHSGLGMSNLFDNLIGPAYQHGGNPKGLPPAMGRGQVFWNWKVGRYEPYKGRIKNSLWKARGLPAFIAVGVSGMYGQPLYYELGGQKRFGDADSLGVRVERFNEPAGEPPSLFLFQREKQLGKGKVFDF